MTRETGRLGRSTSKIRLISHRAFGFHSADPLSGAVGELEGELEVEQPIRGAPTRPPSSSIRTRRVDPEKDRK